MVAAFPSGVLLVFLSGTLARDVLRSVARKSGRILSAATQI